MSQGFNAFTFYERLKIVQTKTPLNVCFWGDSVEKLCVQSRFLCLIILAEHSGCLRSAHFTAIDVEFGHFPEVLGGSGEEELIIDAAGAT